jgi:AcrR family transcriptional regulator
MSVLRLEQDAVKMPSMSAPERSYGGRSSQERTEGRRQQLVEAAIAVLASKGERATMTAICHEAGLTERYFYESFANRDAALVAALDTVTEEIAQDAVRALQETPGSVEDRVHAMTRSFAHWAADQPERALVAVVHATATGPLRERRHELIGSFAETAAQEAANLYGDQAWPPDRARVQGLVLIGGLAELVASWLRHEVDMDTDELASAAADLFVALSRRPQA